jgi:hypothetical protein
MVIAKRYSMKIKYIYIIIMVLLIGCVSSPVRRVNVDRKVFAAIRDAVDNIQHNPNVSEFKYIVNPSEGTISTDWYRTHKGEVRLKIICKVEHENYQITVIQKGLLSNSENSDSAKMVKKGLIEEINENIRKP